MVIALFVGIGLLLLGCFEQETKGILAGGDYCLHNIGVICLRLSSMSTASARLWVCSRRMLMPLGGVNV